MIVGQIIGNGEFTDRFISHNLLYFDNPLMSAYESVRHEWDHTFGLYSLPDPWECPICRKEKGERGGAGN